MSVRDFKNFSKGATNNSVAPMPYIKNKGNVIYIKGKRAIIINKNLNRKLTVYIQKIVNVALEALEKEGFIVPIFVQNRKDTRRFAESAMQLKKKMGIK